MANSYTRTLVETTAAISLISKPTGVLARAKWRFFRRKSGITPAFFLINFSHRQ